MKLIIFQSLFARRISTAVRTVPFVRVATTIKLDKLSAIVAEFDTHLESIRTMMQWNSSTAALSPDEQVSQNVLSFEQQLNEIPPESAAVNSENDFFEKAPFSAKIIQRSDLSDPPEPVEEESEQFVRGVTHVSFLWPYFVWRSRSEFRI